MQRPILDVGPGCRPAELRRGFTLFEVLMAITLTLIILGAVVSVFGLVSSTINDSRSTIEMTERLRNVALRLQDDLAGHTVTPIPPRRPQDNEGYLEIIEGPPYDSSGNRYGAVAIDPSLLDPSDSTQLTTDYTVSDKDDIIMLTTHGDGTGFVGRTSEVRWANSTNEINTNPGGDSKSGGYYYKPFYSTTRAEAEVAWFVRGRTLFRRVMLVGQLDHDNRNTVVNTVSYNGFYRSYDFSVHYSSGNIVAYNTLGDLTKRENRYAHPRDMFPFSIQRWGAFGLPTLRECTSTDSTDTKYYWRAGITLPPSNLRKWGTNSQDYQYEDCWSNNPGDRVSITNMEVVQGSKIQPIFNLSSNRFAEDVILSNVIGFDVKVWDPGAPVFRVASNPGNQLYAVAPGDPGWEAAQQSSKPVVESVGAYVDLGYMFPSGTKYVVPATAPAPQFSFSAANPPIFNNYNSKSYVGSNVYDTWSTHYNEGGKFGTATKGDATFLGTGVNGFDDNGDGVVDDPGEQETAPPYAAPLRGIQVKIRVFEPTSRQIREVTVVQDFLPR